MFGKSSLFREKILIQINENDILNWIHRKE